MRVGKDKYLNKLKFQYSTPDFAKRALEIPANNVKLSHKIERSLSLIFEYY